MHDDRQEPDPEQAWKALGLVNEWVRHAEGKIIATLAAAGVSGGLLYNLATGWKNPSIVAYFLGYATLILLMGTVWACAAGLIPQRKVKPDAEKKPWFERKTAVAAADSDDAEDPPDEPVNLLFYLDIAKAYGDSDLEYSEVLASLTRDRKSMTEHVARQVWANATVADRKYTQANRAIIGLLISWLLLGALAYVRAFFN